ncbi:MAG: peptidyl-prolyl cis-trans isomerase A (cyclophilin A) [Polaribacter sp.]
MSPKLGNKKNLNLKIMNNGIYAKFTTSKGEILVQLEHEKTPGTVGNFVALSEGNLENAVKEQGTPYYNGLKFHRVIPDFMVQGGCPQGSGTGNPGYKFDDEFHSDLKHDAPGKLSMANSGPATNGSQFYITHVPTPWLDGKHTVFGSVIEGQDIVDAIAQGDELSSVEIVRVGGDAEAFNAVEAFRTFEGSREKREANEKAKQKELLDSVALGYEETASGLRYQILQKGTGKQATKGAGVSVHYKGQLLDGTVFDSSYKRKEPIDFNVGVGQVIAGWDEGVLLLQVGDKARFVVPSNLAYGAAGAGGVIPPDATLIFDVELMGVK